MKKLLALLVFALCVTPVFADNSGLALEAFSDGTAGIGYYQPMWAAGVSGRYTRLDESTKTRNLAITPWLELRTSVAPNTNMFAGVSVGMGFLGLAADEAITKDLTPALFTGFDYEISSKILVQSFVSYSVRSYTTPTDVAHSEATLGATLGLSYFL